MARCQIWSWARPRPIRAWGQAQTGTLRTPPGVCTLDVCCVSRRDISALPRHLNSTSQWNQKHRGFALVWLMGLRCGIEMSGESRDVSSADTTNVSRADEVYSLFTGGDQGKGGKQVSGGSNLPRNMRPSKKDSFFASFWPSALTTGLRRFKFSKKCVSP